MTPLKLQQRDDPLAVSEQPPAAASRAGRAAPTRGTPRHSQKRAAHRRDADAPRGPATRASAAGRRWGRGITYDDDRLEQTGWRLYESLLTRVRDRAQELTDAGIPTSAAALAAATLHSHLPGTVEEGTELMRVYRQASAGRPRARRGALVLRRATAQQLVGRIRPRRRRMTRRESGSSPWRGELDHHVSLVDLPDPLDAAADRLRGYPAARGSWRRAPRTARR